jgi:uncharacterized protein
MGNLLQDQLLKAGLVTQKQAKKAEHEKRISRKQNIGTSSTVPGDKVREEQAAEKMHTRALNLQRDEEARLREQQAQVKQLIESNRLSRDGGGEPYHFVVQNKVKRIFIPAELVDQLSRGQLAIVKFGGSYEIVPARVASQIASRDKEALVVCHEKA